MIRHRLEVWSRTGTQRRAIFGALYRAERRQVLQGEEVATYEVSAQDGALSSLVSGSVLRLQREGVGADATLWRLTSRAKIRAADDALRYQITADALWMDLRQGMVRQRLVDGRSLYAFGLNGLTPRQWLEDFILPGYDGTAIGFQLGVVEITEPVDLSFERTNPLAALRALEGAAEGEAQFRLDPSGAFYWVDFLERIGAEQGTAELRYGKNLTGLEREEDETDVETRLYATGAGLLTLADAEWRIGSLSGTTAARVITFDGPSPVHEDGAFVGLWLSVAGKGRYPITASNAAAGTLTVNGTSLPALAMGDRGHLVTDAQGTRLAYLESPAGRADYGVRTGSYQAEDVPDAVNAVPNSDLAAWSGGLPTGWTKLGTPTVTEETDRYYAHQGERAARTVATEGDHGLLSPAFTLSNPADRPYTALLAGLVLISGSVRLELRRQGGEAYPIGERPVLIDLGIYSTMTAGPVHDEPIPAGTYQVAIVAHGGAAEWVLDCAMVTPVIGEEVPAYVAGSGAHLLWERAAWELEERRRPRVEYRVDVADLYRADPAAFRFDELRLGDSVKLRDPEFPRETTRIVELTQDILDARATQVALADSARLRVHDPFRPPPPPLGGSRAGIGRRSSGTEGAAVLQVMRQWDGATGRLTLGALGSPVVATLELRTRTSPADPWVLADTIAGRQGWFTPIANPSDDLLIQITPKDGRGVAGEAVEDTARGAKGADGEPSTSYWLTTGAASIKRSLAGAYTPASLAISARSQTGTAAPAAYAGRFVVATLSGTTWTDRYTSPGEQSSYTYTPPAGVDAVRVRLYMAGGTVALLDEVVVPIVEDGPKGDQGDLGRDVVLTPRWRQGPGSARIEVGVHYGSGSRSLQVQYQYASVPGGGLDRSVNYTTDLPAGGTATKHLILDETGSVRFWPVEPVAPQITVTPYTQPGGTGEAGTPAVLQIEPLAESGDVGVRIAVQGSSTVYQADRLMVKPPSSLGLQIVPDPVTGRPLLQIGGAAGPEQGGIGQIGPMIKGAMLYAGGVGSDRFLVVQPGGVGQYLKMGAGDTPEWGSVEWADGFTAYDFRYSQHGHKHSALDITSGVLSLERGGLGKASFTKNQILYANVDEAGAGYIDGVGPGAPGQVLTMGASFPQWQNLPSTDIPLPTEAGQFLIAAGAAPNFSWVRSAYRLPSGPPAEGMILRGTSTAGGTTWGWVPWSSLDSTTIPIYAQRWPTPAEVGAVPSGGGVLSTGSRFAIVRDPTASGAAASTWVEFQGANNVALGYIGFGSTADNRLHIRNFLGGPIDIAQPVEVNNTLIALGLKKTSARWLKRDIEDAPDALKLLSALRPRQFRWRESGEWDMGFVADEVPAVIGTPEQDAVDFDRITAALVGGWQTHDARLAALERRLGALEGV